MASNSSLLQWLESFELDGQKISVGTKGDDAYYNIADGYVCARILNQISPLNFPDKWLEGIKPVPPNGSWRLRVSNLKRILQKIHDYASDLQNSQFRALSEITPDVAVIAQNFDPGQINRLIQLILFCAINCPNKQNYIGKIQDLPKQMKQDIKEAIEELLVKNNDYQKFNTSHNESVDSESNLDTSHHQKSTKSASNNIISSPARSTSSIAAINRSFLRRDSSADISRKNDSNLDTSNSSNHDNPMLTPEELRQKLSVALTIQDEKAQACYDLEMKLRQLQLEKEQLALENERLNSDRNNSNQRKLSIASSRRPSHCEAFDESDNDCRNFENRLKNLEDDNAHSMILQKNVKLQNELHKLKEDMIKTETEKEDYRLKSELLKEDLTKITLKHDELRNKAEYAKRLQDELDEHRQMSEKVINYEAMMENLVKKNNDYKKDLKSLEEKNSANKSKISKLEEENGRLSNASREIEIYKKQLHEVQVRLSQETYRADKAEVEVARLSERYSTVKKENEKLYEATNQLMRNGVSTTMRDIPESPTGGHNSGTALNQNLNSSDNTLALINRVEELQRLIFQKEQELLDSETKYKRNILKAKEVIKSLNNNPSLTGGSLHQSGMSSTSSFNCSSIDETNLILKQQLKDREDRLIETERQFYEYKKFKEMEERLMISAFYGLVSIQSQ